MKGHIGRWTASALAVLLGLVVCAPPALADARPPAPQSQSLAKLSPASLELLRSEVPAKARAAQVGTASDTPFFKTKRGMAVLGLMAAGVAFTVWSARHDREPVKSPIR